METKCWKIKLIFFCFTLLQSSSVPWCILPLALGTNFKVTSLCYQLFASFLPVPYQNCNGIGVSALILSNAPCFFLTYSGRGGLPILSELQSGCFNPHMHEAPCGVAVGLCLFWLRLVGLSIGTFHYIRLTSASPHPSFVHIPETGPIHFLWCVDCTGALSFAGVRFSGWPVL